MITQCRIFLQKQPWIGYLGVFVVVWCYLFSLQFSDAVADPDSFYHIKVAMLMAQRGWVLEFPSLPFTIFTNGYVDHHFLYHLWLMPFVSWLPPFVGAKIGHTLLATGFIVLLYHYMRRLTVRWPALYIFALLLSQVFIFRLSLIKAQPLSLILLFTALYLLIKKRYAWLLPLGAVYVWAYDGWPILLVVTSLYILADWLNQAPRSLKIREWWQHVLLGFKTAHYYHLLGLSVIGIILGIIINPFFPQNLNFYWLHIWQIGVVNLQSVIDVGAEWYPLKPFNFMRAIAIALVPLLMALVLMLTYRPRTRAVTTLLLLDMFFLVMAIKSRRNIEYLVPLLVWSSAVIITTCLKQPQAQIDLTYFKARVRWFWDNQLQNLFTGAVLVVSIGCIGIVAWFANQQTLQSVPETKLSGVSQYLKNHSQPGDIVFHSDWDDFPLLWYHNDSNRYIIGLDPTFLFAQNSQQYQDWLALTKGERAAESYYIVKEEFSAAFVLINKENSKMPAAFVDPKFKKVYEDREAIVYQVL
ncbi:MAG: hypothetical protein KBB55_00235 [Candidatus Buchananbacteria bacterium]|nr:hypothetical protein [Candidatus Buchananbacteria bacterium]